MISTSWSNPIVPPKICSSPPSGYSIGGDIFITKPLLCDNSTSVQLTNIKESISNILLQNPVFYLNIDDSFDLGKATNGIPSPSTPFEPKLGENWILLTGEFGGKKYLTCSLQRTIIPQKPVASALTSSITNPNEVKVTIPVDDNNQHDLYFVDWGNETTEIINTKITPLPQVRKESFAVLPANVIVRGSYSEPTCPTPEPSSIKINDAQKSFIYDLRGEDGGKKATIRFISPTTLPDKLFDVWFAIDNGTGLTNWTKRAEGKNGIAEITGLDPNNKYCFKLSIKNDLGVDVFSDNIVCTVNLQANLKTSSKLELKWNAPIEPKTTPTTVSLSGAGTGGPLLDLATSTIIPFDCANSSVYFVKYNYRKISFDGASYNLNISSAEVEVDIKTNGLPKPLNLLSVGFDPTDDSKIRVSIVVDPKEKDPYNYIFYRALNDSPDFQKVKETKTNVFDDLAIPNQTNNYCYKYQIEDKCGNITPISDPFCTIKLDSKINGIVNWTSYDLPTEIYTKLSPAEYTLEFFDTDLKSYYPVGRTDKLQENIEKILGESKQSEVKFRVFVKQTVDLEISMDYPILSYSNTYSVRIPPGLFIPTVFTPDGRGPSESETFKILGKFISNGNFKIFDRWGGVIFKANSLTDTWDGTESNGIKPAPSGTYAYLVNATSDTGESFKKTGTFTLLR